MNNKINFAFITALYDYSDANLYSELYFPIIEYSIAWQYNLQSQENQNYELDDLKKVIVGNSGIPIPIDILKKSLKAIRSNNISVSVIPNTTLYSIKKGWNAEKITDVSSKTSYFHEAINRIETSFRKHLEENSLEYNKSFIDFYSDHTEDILNYLGEDNKESLVNEEYVNLVKFLEVLRNEDSELYEIANKVLWSSIIAGFLSRDKADIDIKPESKVNYYLDTAIVMAILELSSSKSNTYSAELLDFIKGSSNNAVVHPLTLKEIDSILYNVEIQGPRPSSQIAEAYNNLQLTPSRIKILRKDLRAKIEEKGMLISSDTIDKDKIDKYKRNPKVIKLSEVRNSKWVYVSGNGDIDYANQREIHDVYMIDYVNKIRGNISDISKAKCVFVSLNNDMINMVAKEKVPIAIHPSTLVVDLWLHNPNNNSLKKNALTEVVSRCIALNDVDVKRKLHVVISNIKKCGIEMSEENFKCIYNALAVRSKDVLNKYDEVEGFVNADDSQKAEHSNALNNLLSESQKLFEKKEEEFSKMGKKVEELDGSVKKLIATLSTETIAKNEAEGKFETLIDLLDKNEKLHTSIQTKEQEYSRLYSEYSNLKNKREKSYNIMFFYIKLWGGVIAVLIFVILLIISIKDLKGSNLRFIEWLKNNTILSSVNVLSLISTFVLFFKYFWIFDMSHYKRKYINEHHSEWDKCHKEYGEIENKVKLQSDEIRSLKAEKEVIEDRIIVLRKTASTIAQ